jgi:KUP system potassium uptake protein
LPKGEQLDSVFYATVPQGWLPYVIGIATVSTIVASQALITGIFTLVNEAIKLKLWTNLKVKYPSDHKGQIYIPFINYFLLVGCLLVVFIFKRSSNMESAYGLAITIDMLMTSLLLGYLLLIRAKKGEIIITLLFSLFLLVETTFLISNLNKIIHGGWFTLLLALFLFTLLLFYRFARQLRSRVAEYQKLEEVTPLLTDVMNNDKLPYLATNLVLPTRSSRVNFIDMTIVHSLFYLQPKKAEVYWFLHLHITDVPYGIAYTVTTIIPQKCFFIKLNIGFKERHLLDYKMKNIHADLVKSGEVSGHNIFYQDPNLQVPPDFKYILINSRVASDNRLTVLEAFSVRIYRFLKSMGLTAIEDFGLDETNTIEEKIPINVAKRDNLHITRIES